MIARFACGLLLVLVALHSSFALAVDQEWGTLKGQFVLDGPVPEKRYVDTSAKEGVGEVLAEDLVVDADGGVRYIAIFLRNKPGVQWPVHPAYDDPKTFGPSVTIRQQGFRFVPRVTTVQVEQEIILANSDSQAHNPVLTSDSERNYSFQQHLLSRQLTDFRLRSPECRPLPLADNYFPWMQGYVFVRNNPYAAVTDASGTFEIKNLPVGQHEFKVWHEGNRVEKATLGGQPVEWKRGVAAFEIKPGMNDLGKILVKLGPKGDVP